MSYYEFFDTVLFEGLNFDPSNGSLVTEDAGGRTGVTLPKREAINLASKLLQWGTSS